MDWASRLYAYFGKSYRYLDPPPPYRVFMRFLPSGTGGGTALPRSFMLSALAGPPKPGATAPHGTLAHEMTQIQMLHGMADSEERIARSQDRERQNQMLDRTGKVSDYLP